MQVIGKIFSVCRISLGGNKVHVGLPQTINSGHGEIIQFKECIQEPDSARLVFEGIVQPGCGPIFHVHLCQAEGFEVRQGTMASGTFSRRDIRMPYER